MKLQASPYRVRAGAVALAVAGLLFVLYPALRPFSDETTLAGAQAFASNAWVLSHVMGMLGFIGVGLGLLALHIRLAGTPAARPSFWAVLLGWIGVGLTLTYYGAEVYGLRVIGRLALSEHDASVLTLAGQVRGAPGAVIFAIGMVMLAVAGVIAAVASWRLAGLPRWGALVVAAGLVLYIPQFFAGQPVRIAHGALLAAGCLGLAAGLWPARPGPVRATRLAGQNAAQRAQGGRQVGGADGTESEQQALPGRAGVEEVLQAHHADTVSRRGRYDLVLAQPVPEQGGDVEPGVGGVSGQVASQRSR